MEIDPKKARMINYLISLALPIPELQEWARCTE